MVGSVRYVLLAILTLAGLSSTGCEDRADSRAGSSGAAAAFYFPGHGEDWERKLPDEVGMDGARLQAAIDFAEAHETSMDDDLGEYLQRRFEGEADQEILGPTMPRGGVNGIVLRNGYIVAEWGDTERADMTFSVTKSYLSTLAGVAVGRGLIRDLDAPVRDLVGELFDSEHNGSITWRHLLQQTSEWTGTLWDKPDTADRRRGVDRTLQRPGAFWEYNDVRVNLLAVSLLHVFGRSLADVLKDEIMDPIGSSDSWRWHGYRNSVVDIDGEPVRSVSGGGHWGGGLFISTRDHARFGYLFLRRGNWNERELLIPEWVDWATSPAEIQPGYGFMWWLNTGRERFPSAPERAYFALGAGATSTIVVDPEHDVVIVSRWVEGEHVDGVIQRVLDAIQPSSAP